MVASQEKKIEMQSNKNITLHGSLERVMSVRNQINKSPLEVAAYFKLSNAGKDNSNKLKRKLSF